MEHCIEKNVSDVQVYVIDTGKVKQQSYDPFSESTRLETVDISQSCSKQRAGRAGRVRRGYCYCLNSLRQYNSMAKYTMPDILRMSLHNVCLKVSMLTSDLTIEQALSEALEPPSKKRIHCSVEFLKKINALDTNENITALGTHLAHMPIDCQLGKMVLYSIVLRCLDPVVAIVSALSVKDPFLLRIQNDENKMSVNQAKKEFAKNSSSDHRMLLNAFEAWKRATSKDQFCKENVMSKRNMATVEGVRLLIMRHLKTTGLIDDSKSKILNDNALKWEIIKACLTTGIYRKFTNEIS